MGGPRNLNLLFNAIKLTGAKCIVETGVAYGWSSLANIECNFYKWQRKVI